MCVYYLHVYTTDCINMFMDVCILYIYKCIIICTLYHCVHSVYMYIYMLYTCVYIQGVTFKIPNVDRSPMDLHTIFKVCVCVCACACECVRVCVHMSVCVCVSPLSPHQAVTGFGGFREMTKQRKWTQLAREV